MNVLNDPSVDRVTDSFRITRFALSTPPLIAPMSVASRVPRPQILLCEPLNLHRLDRAPNIKLGGGT